MHRSSWPKKSVSGQGKKDSMRQQIKILPKGTVVVFVMVLVVSGCNRKSSETVNSQTNQAASAAAPIVQTGQPDMAAVDRAARLWMFSNHRRPTNWDDFAANAGIQIPPPPPGKKYVLSKDMRVSLVDR